MENYALVTYANYYFPENGNFYYDKLDIFRATQKMAGKFYFSFKYLPIYF